MNALPAGLPSIAEARLPATYEAAKTALAECSRLDECQDWADKAEALASYAKQANDDALRKFATRIQSRAINRCGELLKQIDRPEQGGRPPKNGAGTDIVSRSQAARDAGLSDRQKVTALRVASVPHEDFERQVESENPPTVTALAEQGKKARPLVDLGGRSESDFAAATEAQGHLRVLAKFCERADAATIARGTKPHELAAMRQQIATIDAWLDQLVAQLEGRNVHGS